MMEHITILGDVMRQNSLTEQDFQKFREFVETMNEYHEYHINHPVLITLPDGKTPRQRRRQEARKNKVRRKWKPLY